MSAGLTQTGTLFFNAKITSFWVYPANTTTIVLLLSDCNRVDEIVGILLEALSLCQFWGCGTQATDPLQPRGSWHHFAQRLKQRGLVVSAKGAGGAGLRKNFLGDVRCFLFFIATSEYFSNGACHPLHPSHPASETLGIPGY